MFNWFNWTIFFIWIGVTRELTRLSKWAMSQRNKYFCMFSLNKTKKSSSWPRLDRWRRFQTSRACRSRRGPPHPGPTSRGSALSPRCRTRSCSAPPRSSGCTCDPLVRMGELKDWHEPYEPGSDDKMIKDLLNKIIHDWLVNTNWDGRDDSS